MTASLFVYALAVCALFQPNAPRLFAAVCFAWITLGHELLLSDLDGILYYGSAALCDLAVIILISGIDPVPRMVLDVQRVCLVSIAANAVGWVLWFAYVSPLWYNFAFLFIYAWALASFMHRDGTDVGGFTLDSWVSCIRSHPGARLVRFYQHKGTP